MATTEHDPGMRARRERVVVEHMESESVQQWNRTMQTVSHPRYEMIPSGRVIDGADDVAAYWNHP